MSSFNRRDFLTMLPLLSGALAFSRLPKKFALSLPAQDGSQPNVIILLFDAMSAKNLSLYGYKRHTTPNLKRFAETATVYNTHYSAGNFTTPGTASLLTGLYPWTHRAINYSGLVARDRADENIFAASGEKYHRLAFSQNPWVDYLFGQFRHNIDKILPAGSFSLVDAVAADKLGGDITNELRAYDDFLFKYNGDLPGSLVFGSIGKLLVKRQQILTEYREEKLYQFGMPHSPGYANFFVLSDLFDGLMTTIHETPSPSFSYWHLWPPHEPFNPTRDFDHLFADGWSPPKKPRHILGEGNKPRAEKGRRQLYDEYIANVDAEFGRLLDFMKRKGILEKSYFIVTSDHGQLFERGVVGHATPLLYDPVVRVPLLISAPGQTTRQDVNSPTCSVDLLPSLIHLINGQIPEWCEGTLLPFMGGEETLNRPIFMMDAKFNPAFSALLHASFAMRKGRYKLIYYKGYSEYDGKNAFELYDLVNDPEELNDLYFEKSSIASSMRDELLAKVESVNSKYKR